MLPAMPESLRVEHEQLRADLEQALTRKQELLIEAAVLQKIWVLRKLLYPMDDMEAMEFLSDEIRATKDNAGFFDSMRRG